LCATRRAFPVTEILRRSAPQNDRRKTEGQHGDSSQAAAVQRLPHFTRNDRMDIVKLIKKGGVKY
jgi:hypothetical protein